MKTQKFLTEQEILPKESSVTQSLKSQGRVEYVLGEIGKGKRVLDLGCLGGLFSKLIQDRNNEVFGVEINAEAAKLASSRGVKVRVFDLNEGIPFQDAFFDVVYGGDLLEYIFDTRFLFDEIHRVLKPTGFFLFSVPNVNSWRNRLRVLKGDFVEGLGAYPEDHGGDRLRIFNLEKVRELCQVSGFEIAQLSGFGELPFANRLLNQAFRFWPSVADTLLITAKLK